MNLENARIKIVDSSFQIGNYLKVKNELIILSNNSKLNIGNFCLFEKKSYYSSGLNTSGSQVTMGDNVNVRCKVNINVSI